MPQLKYYDSGSSSWIPVLAGAQGTVGIQGLKYSAALNASLPSSPVSGDVWFDLNSGRMAVWNGTEWFEPYSNLNGAQGTTGLQGILGAQGLQGLDGAFAAQGIQGLVGSQGVQGSLGQISFPIVTQTSSYILQSSDNGKVISSLTGGVTVQLGVFNPGDNIVIFNNSTSSQNITQGTGVTLRFPTTVFTGNRVLSQYGLATILCVDVGVFTVSGPGVS
jgi:hypothetical protein